MGRKAVPQHNKDAYRDEEVDQCAQQIQWTRRTVRTAPSARPRARWCQHLMGHVRPRFRYQDYPVAAPIHRGSATGRQAASASSKTNVDTLLRQRAFVRQCPVRLSRRQTHWWFNDGHNGVPGTTAESRVARTHAHGLSVW
jgi:hypothetical protein